LESARSIVSSEYTITNTFKGVYSSGKFFSWTSCNSETFNSDKESLKSFRKGENKMRYRISPCLTQDRGVRQGQIWLFTKLYWTHYFMLSYILYTTFNIFPFMPLVFFSVRQTVSKALWKSLNAQNSFFYQTLGIKISEIGVKTYTLW
jgi:hypothetical protein